MTRQRIDLHSTEFGLWLRNKRLDNKTILRNPDLLDSGLGFVTTNIDYVWRNYKTGQWMLIEEKRYNGQISFAQNAIFHIVDTICKSDPNYKGFHIVRFEKTSPEDGKMLLDNMEVSREQLIAFLRFEFEKVL